jgi:3-oxoacyl-[acyl-carrier protein] reductase
MGLLEGKVALVTGAGRGIGSSIARLFAAEGAAVAVHYHQSEDPARKLADEIGKGAAVFQADLTRQEDAERLVANVLTQYGRIDILVNNAASFAQAKPFAEDDWARYMEEWNGVVGATFHPTRAAIAPMTAQGGGRIVNFLATLIERPAVGYGAHTTAKSALLGLTRTLARELGPSNILVNAVSPGMTMTEFSSSLPEEERTRVARLTPLRRVAEPDDVARVVLFFASDLSGFVTGSHLAPDGGLAVL